MVHHHEQPMDPAVRRHRGMFAVLRIAEVSFAVLGLLTSLLVFTAPSSPGSTTRALYFIAWSTPRIFVATAAAMFAVADLLDSSGSACGTCIVLCSVVSAPYRVVGDPSAALRRLQDDKN
jgi:hypothetical protein